MIEILKLDWPVAHICGGWTRFDPARVAATMKTPVALLSHLKLTNADKVGAAIARVPVSEFQQFRGATPAPQHKCGREKGRIKWHPTLLFNLQSATLGADVADLVVPVWLHPDLSGQLHVPSESLAHFVSPLIGSGGCRIVSARELLTDSDTIPCELDLSTLTEEACHECD